MTTTTEASPEALRDRMVDRILASQSLTPTVEAALRRVERHRYVPNVPLADAYAEKAVITHTFPDGSHLSCASGPSIVAGMLNALDVQPGQRIMEIGAGTGYNAALLATLAGTGGQVTTIDINPDVTADARRNLDNTGFHHVRVITRDGAEGLPEHAPHDRIIVTVGAWDIPQAWWDQLEPGGRLVLPLRWRGTTRAVAFVKRDDRWESDWVFLCGFVPMLGQPGEQYATIDADGLVTLHYDVDQSIDIAALQGVLDGPKSVVWSDATVHGEEPFDRVWLHLSVVDNGTAASRPTRRPSPLACAPRRSPLAAPPSSRVIRWPTSRFGGRKYRGDGGSSARSGTAHSATNSPPASPNRSTRGTRTARAIRNCWPTRPA